MEDWLGKKVTVQRAKYDPIYKQWSINLEEVGWLWCENCFEESVPSVHVPITGLNSLL